MESVSHLRTLNRGCNCFLTWETDISLPGRMGDLLKVTHWEWQSQDSSNFPCSRQDLKDNSQVWAQLLWEVKTLCSLGRLSSPKQLAGLSHAPKDASSSWPPHRGRVLSLLLPMGVGGAAGCLASQAILSSFGPTSKVTSRP